MAVTSHAQSRGSIHTQSKELGLQLRSDIFILQRTRITLYLRDSVSRLISLRPVASGSYKTIEKKYISDSYAIPIPVVNIDKRLRKSLQKQHTARVMVKLIPVQ